MADDSRSSAQGLAREYGLPPLPSLDQEVGCQQRNRNIEEASGYSDAMLLVLVDVTDQRIDSWDFSRTISEISSDSITSVVFFEDHRYPRNDGAVLELVDASEGETRTGFYSLPLADVERTYFDLFSAGLAAVHWDESQFDAGFQRVLQEVALFRDGDNRADAVRNLVETTSL